MLSRSLRKRRRRRNGFNFKFIIIIFIVSVSFISIGYSYLSENLSIEGKGNLVKYVEPYSGDYKATYSLDKWYSDQKFYYNYNLNITNLTNKDIQGWEIIVYLPEKSEAVTSWNADIKQDGNKFIFTNKNYNGTLRAGVETSFGFQFQSKSTGDWLPIFIRINGKKIKIANLPADVDPGDDPIDDPIYIPDDPEDDPMVSPSESPLKISIISNGSWSSGNTTTRQYILRINNTSNNPTKSWKIKMSKIAAAHIDSAWNYNYVETDDYVLFSNGEWNGTIDAKKSIDLQFQISSTNNNYNPQVIGVESKY